MKMLTISASIMKEIGKKSHCRLEIKQIKYEKETINLRLSIRKVS